MRFNLENARAFGEQTQRQVPQLQFSRITSHFPRPTRLTLTSITFEYLLPATTYFNDELKH